MRQTIPRSILLLTDEHGKSVLDDTPLRAQAIFELSQIGLLYVVCSGRFCRSASVEVSVPLVTVCRSFATWSRPWGTNLFEIIETKAVRDRRESGAHADFLYFQIGLYDPAEADLEHV